MIDEFKEWKEKQEPFTDDAQFFETDYAKQADFLKALFKEIYRLNEDQKLLARAVANIIEDMEDD